MEGDGAKTKKKKRRSLLSGRKNAAAAATAAAAAAAAAAGAASAPPADDSSASGSEAPLPEVVVEPPPTAAAAPAAAAASAAPPATGESSDDGATTAAAAAPAAATSTMAAPSSPSESSSRDSTPKMSPKSSPLLRRLSLFLGKKYKDAHASGRGAHAATAKGMHGVQQMGKGHTFGPFELVRPMWCDVCDNFIWGLLKECVQCESCKIVCHEECQIRLVLDCAGKANTQAADAESPRRAVQRPMSPLAKDTKGKQRKGNKTQLAGSSIEQRVHPVPGPGLQGVLAFLDKDDVARMIKDYNEKATGLKMEFLDDENPKLFRGYIRVAMNLTRPIRVASEDVYWSLQQNLNDPGVSPEPQMLEVDEATRRMRRMSSSSSAMGMASAHAAKLGDSETSFFLPQDVSKGLFLTSTTTATEVISILLRKFKVISPPRKFALYEKNLVDGSTRRLRRFEEPLVLALHWGGDNKNLSLSLQENEESGDFNWEEFSAPELENFLRILREEEEQHVAQVEKRFTAKRTRLEAALDELLQEEAGGKGSTDGSQDASNAAATADAGKNTS